MSETTFSHQNANSPDAHYSDGGLRSFFVYRDAGVNPATKGEVRVQLVRAAHKSSEAKGGTGFHFHTADVHVVYMVRGWAKFDYHGVDTLVEAGDCVHQRPGIVHSLYDWSDDKEPQSRRQPRRRKTATGKQADRSTPPEKVELSPVSASTRWP